MVRLAGTEVKIGHAGVEIFDQEALNGGMQRGTLRRLAIGSLFVAVLGGLHYMSVHDKPVGSGLGCDDDTDAFEAKLEQIAKAKRAKTKPKRQAPKPR